MSSITRATALRPAWPRAAPPCSWARLRCTARRARRSTSCSTISCGRWRFSLRDQAFGGPLAPTPGPAAEDSISRSRCGAPTGCGSTSRARKRCCPPSRGSATRRWRPSEGRVAGVQPAAARARLPGRAADARAREARRRRRAARRSRRCSLLLPAARAAHLVHGRARAAAPRGGRRGGAGARADGARAAPGLATAAGGAAAGRPPSTTCCARLGRRSRSRARSSWPMPPTSCARRSPRCTCSAACSRAPRATRSARLPRRGRRECSARSAWWSSCSLSRARSRAARRRASPRSSSMSLRARIVAELVPLAEPERIDLGVEAAAAGRGDRRCATRCATLLRNLVDNAVRYTPARRPGGRERRRRRWPRRRAPDRSEDDGPGIAAAERARVFDRFYRAPAACPPGSGLGLAIVKAIADAHGATVTLADGAAGRGLSVTVSFPASFCRKLAAVSRYSSRLGFFRKPWPSSFATRYQTSPPFARTPPHHLLGLGRRHARVVQPLPPPAAAA